MTDFAPALLQRIRSLPAMAGIGAAYGLRPQGQALPWIGLSIISDPRDYHFEEQVNERESRVQVAVHASTFGEARRLALVLARALMPPAAVGGVTFNATGAAGPIDFSELVGGAVVHRSIVDLFVRHNGD